MEVCRNKLVRIAVKMYDLQGHLLEQTEPEGIVYLHGHGDIFPAFEAKLDGKTVGASLDFTLEPEEAFGEFDEELVAVVDVQTLGRPEEISVGLAFERCPELKPGRYPYRVTDLAAGKAVLDANHPLAGWSLRFKVTVLSVETPVGEATGNDEVVVPGFLGFAEKLLPETDE